jgi:hypothetical protein
VTQAQDTRKKSASGGFASAFPERSLKRCSRWTKNDAGGIAAWRSSQVVISNQLRVARFPVPGIIILDVVAQSDTNTSTSMHAVQKEPLLCEVRSLKSNKLSYEKVAMDVPKVSYPEVRRKIIEPQECCKG